MHAAGPIHGIWRSLPMAQPKYPATPTSMLSMKTSRYSGSYIPLLRCDIQTTSQSLSGPVTSIARVVPTMPVKFIRA